MLEIYRVLSRYPNYYYCRLGQLDLIYFECLIVQFYLWVGGYRVWVGVQFYLYLFSVLNVYFLYIYG